MESLKFYIKERIPFVVIYGLSALFFVLFLSNWLYGLITEFSYVRLVCFIVLFSILFLLGAFYFVGVIKFVRVLIDYKKQETETKVVYVKNQVTDFCLDIINGAYKIFHCSDNRNGKRTEYWMYRKSLIYDHAFIGEQYKITYYKRSKCLIGIEPAFDISKKARTESQIKKSLKVQKDKRVRRQKEIEIRLAKEASKKSNKKVVTEIVTTLGIPYEHVYDIYSKPRYVYWREWHYWASRATPILKVKNGNGKKIRLLLPSKELLGLGCLEERPGFLGYGNFIGMKYEVEYYKHSKIIKSMKIINEP